MGCGPSAQAQSAETPEQIRRNYELRQANILMQQQQHLQQPPHPAMMAGGGGGGGGGQPYVDVNKPMATYPPQQFGGAMMMAVPQTMPVQGQMMMAAAAPPIYVDQFGNRIPTDQFGRPVMMQMQSSVYNNHHNNMGSAGGMSTGMALGGGLLGGMMLGSMLDGGMDGGMDGGFD